jgi:SAM-dependent methyltransferase
MQAKSYTYVSLIYAHLMRSINYGMWAKYIFCLGNYVQKQNLRVLELACGNGELAKHLKVKFKNYFVTDLSSAMLFSFSHKFKKKVVCELTSLPFKKKFDFVFSTFDSMNYLINSEKFLRMLMEISRLLTDDGIFTFDVSLEKNSLKYQKHLNRTGKVGDVKYKQKSYYNQKSHLHYNHFEITLANGEKVEEIHKQKIYRFEEYFSMIDLSDFYVLECLNAFTFDNASQESERAQFILKKRNKNAFI